MILKVREASGWVRIDNLSEVRTFRHGFSAKYVKDFHQLALHVHTLQGHEHYALVTAYRYIGGPDKASVCERYIFNTEAYVLNDQGDTVDSVKVRTLFPIINTLEELQTVLGEQTVIPEEGGNKGTAEQLTDLMKQYPQGQVQAAIDDANAPLDAACKGYGNGKGLGDMLSELQQFIDDTKREKGIAPFGKSSRKADVCECARYCEPKRVKYTGDKDFNHSADCQCGNCPEHKATEKGPHKVGCGCADCEAVVDRTLDRPTLT